MMTDKTNSANNCDNDIKINDVLEVISLSDATYTRTSHKDFCIFK